MSLVTGVLGFRLGHDDVEDRDRIKGEEEETTKKMESEEKKEKQKEVEKKKEEEKKGLTKLSSNSSLSCSVYSGFNTYLR